jgi:hypothetical protein
MHTWSNNRCSSISIKCIKLKLTSIFIYCPIFFNRMISSLISVAFTNSRHIFQIATRA